MKNIRLLIKKKKSTINVEANLNLQEVFDVIEEVTGVRPIILGNESSVKQKSKSSNDVENFSINLDVMELNISDYATSDILAEYFKQIDYVKIDSTKTISERINLISDIQVRFSQDSKATLNDIEIFFNTTEILKGSLILWNNENSSNHVKQEISGIYYAKPIKEWGFFAKLGFVAAADALGAVAGTFVGGIITVGGVPMYVAPGPIGTAAFAAALSFLAAKMVGW